jgi:carboxypeptidase C (cathepsin A)
MFPEYGKHDLYVTGESYAGVYVPYLALRMDQYNEDNSAENAFRFNLKGFIVGNGVTNWKYDGDPSYIKMGWYFNLYG